MELQRLIKEDLSEEDTTWEMAQAIVEAGLKAPSPLVNLIRSSWNGILDPNSFVKMLGFTGLNPSCLLDAAEMPTDGTSPRAEDLSQAVQTLGVRFSAVVLAINLTVRSVLKSKPGPGWRFNLEQLAKDMEVGYKLGVRVPDLGLEGGLIIGFCEYAGLGILNAVKPDEYKIFHRETRKMGKLGRKRVIELFGCEPFQVSALVIQRMGFGTDLAFGTALAVGRLNPKHIIVEDSAMCWKAGYEWMLALKEGRNYPGALPMRNYFPSITPPKDRKKANRLLEVLYTEVAKVRREGSRWTWHLPKPGYDRTRAAFDL